MYVNYESGVNSSLSNSSRLNYIPVDYIKAKVTDVSLEYLRENTRLEFTPHLINIDEVLYYYTEFNGIQIKSYCESGRIELSGSLHKYYNNGLHNYDDFSNSNFQKMLVCFYNDFKLLPHNLHLMTLEYGVNIIPPIDTENVLNTLIMHKSNEFINPINDHKGNYKQVVHKKYILKIYDKGKQYRTGEQLLRVEMKNRGLSEHKTKGQFTLLDFIQMNKLWFLNDLLNKWNDVILYDVVKEKQNFSDKYGNLSFWRELNEKRKEKNITNAGFKYHVDLLKRRNELNGYDIQNTISELIKTKVIELNDLTNYEVKEESKCLLTGYDISMQRKDSFLLSHSGLWYLFYYNSIEFKRIKERFLSSVWYYDDLETQIKEIAHNIRNYYFNGKRKRLKENPNQLKLIFKSVA